jgi:hypothetical protein
MHSPLNIHSGNTLSVVQMRRGLPVRSAELHLKLG